MTVPPPKSGYVGRKGIAWDGGGWRTNWVSEMVRGQGMRGGGYGQRTGNEVCRLGILSWPPDLKNERRTLAGSSPTTPTDQPVPLPRAMFTKFFTTVVLPELGGPRIITLGPRDDPSLDEPSGGVRA